MQNYLPVCMADQVRHLSLPEPKRPANELMLSDKRRVLADNFDPSYRAQRLGKTIAVRIKPLRLQEKVLEYGNEQLNLTTLVALVYPYQVLAVGHALLFARNRFKNSLLSPSELADNVFKLIEKEGLKILSQPDNGPVFFACPRRLELAGAINRLGNIAVEIVET